MLACSSYGGGIVEAYGYSYRGIVGAYSSCCGGIVDVIVDVIVDD